MTTPAQRAPPNLAPPTADVDVSARGEARSRAFDDIYFSPRTGLDETRAVFLEGCGLPKAWAGRSRFVIAELGFGSGLNFLAAWEAWAASRPEGGRLDFVSVDGFPLSGAQAEKLLSAAPELKRVADPRARGPLVERAHALLKAWPDPIKGVHRRTFPDGVSLTLAHLEVAEALDALEFSADAWFLDGFAPAKNPDMWTPAVIAQIAARSRVGARLATFTVAGDVRRALAAAGFALDKKPGFGAKRERLEAVYEGGAARRPRSVYVPRARARGASDVMIIGAGAAGAMTARAARARGLRAVVLEADAHPAAAASGNRLGLVMPRLDLDDRPEARFHRAAYAFAARYYDAPLYAQARSGAQAQALRAAGLDDGAAPAAVKAPVIEFSRDPEEGGRLEALAKSRAVPEHMTSAIETGQAIELSRVADARAGLIHHEARLVRPAAIVARALLGVDVIADARAARVARDAARWIAIDRFGRTLADADVCIIACGVTLAHFEQTRWLPIAASRGQVTEAELRGPAPGCAFAFGHYAAPAGPDRLVFGATYDPWAPDRAAFPTSSDDARNLAALAETLPDLADRVAPETMSGRASARAVTPDRLPMMGPVPHLEAYATRFADLAKGRRDDSDEPAPLVEGLYVLGGLGSRGFLWAPLLAEALVSEIAGAPGALERGAAEALHPARFLMRALKRGEDVLA